MVRVVLKEKKYTFDVYLGKQLPFYEGSEKNFAHGLENNISHEGFF